MAFSSKLSNVFSKIKGGLEEKPYKRVPRENISRNTREGFYAHLAYSDPLLAATRSIWFSRNDECLVQCDIYISEDKKEASCEDFARWTNGREGEAYLSIKFQDIPRKLNESRWFQGRDAAGIQRQNVLRNEYTRMFSA